MALPLGYLLKMGLEYLVIATELRATRSHIRYLENETSGYFEHSANSLGLWVLRT
jgi:hypothetical protein